MTTVINIDARGNKVAGPRHLHARYPAVPRDVRRRRPSVAQDA
jgi:hypothetical protein